MSKKITIEHQKRFSDTCFWSLQRDYFDEQGVRAWVRSVPFYITSNPFIANGYANVAIQFIRDWVARNPTSKQHPFYILELGTGSGRFSYYVLKRLQVLRQALALDGLNIVYVMSDFTTHNIEYWAAHPALQPYLAEGLVEFARVNLEDPHPITLMRQQKTLSAEEIVNPLIVFANYIFDTISHDMFSVKDKKLHELLLTLSTDDENIQEGRPKDWKKIEIDYHPVAINGHYYPEAALNDVLNEYKTQMGGSSFLFPISAIRAIEALMSLSNGKMLLIGSDKGYSSLAAQDGLGYPKLAFHGSFSVMVNFDAIARFFKHRGGDFVLQGPHKDIQTAVFSLGFELQEMKECSLAIEQFVHQLSLADYFILYCEVEKHLKDCSIETLASQLAFAGWDPHLFMRIKDRLMELIVKADPMTQQYLANHMKNIKDNYYHLPEENNPLIEIAMFFHVLKNYSEALKYYQEASKYSRNHFRLSYNQGLCEYHLGKHDSARQHFEQSLALKPDSADAREWVEYLKPAEP